MCFWKKSNRNRGNEIALLNHGMRDEANVAVVSEKLSHMIGEEMVNWGLISQ